MFVCEFIHSLKLALSHALAVLVAHKWGILVSKCVNLKLEWMENYDIKPEKIKWTLSHAWSVYNEASFFLYRFNS